MAVAPAPLFRFALDADVDEAIRGRRRLYVCRTEAGAAALWEAGLAGVTPVGGWNAWVGGHSARLKGAEVVVLQPPRRHPDPESLAFLVRGDAERIARGLVTFGCQVRLVDLPGLEPDQDVDAWLDEGCGALALERLAAAAPRFRPTPLPEPEADEAPLLIAVAEAEAPAVTELVEGLLPDGMLAVLSGKDKNGKTLLAQEIVRAVLTGQAFLERFAVHKGPVVAAFLDDPLSITLGRLATLGLRRAESLYLIDPQRLGENPFTFLDRLEVEVMLARPVLVVVDALYLLTPTSADASNDAARMTPILRRLDLLATRTGAAVLLIAHDSKSGADVAGSFVVRAMAKTIMRLVLPRGDEAPDDGAPTTPRRWLKVESKLLPGATHVLELAGVGDWRYLGTPDRLRAHDLDAAILEALRGGEALSAKALAPIVQRRATEVRAALERLESAGRIASTVSTTSRGGAPARRYFLPEVRFP